MYHRYRIDMETYRFHPEQLYVAGWTSIGVIFSELVFTRLGCYFLNIPFEASMLDLVAYSGYKYVCIIVSDLVKLFGAGKWLSWMVFIYTSLSVGFFLVSISSLAHTCIILRSMLTSHTTSYDPCVM